MNAKTFFLIAGSVAMACFGPSAHAALTIVSVLGGGPNVGANYVTFNSLPLGVAGGIAPNVAGSASSGGITVSFSPDAKVVNVPASGLYAPPYLSGSNGSSFEGQGPGVDSTNYITSGSFGSVLNSAATLVFSSPQQYFGLLWGSVDDYNTLKFFSGATLVGTMTGSDVVASPNGDQGVNGTRYVNINSGLSFNRVVATSSQYAFEFDNVAYSESQAIPAVAEAPEPASLIVWSLLGLTIGGTSWWRRRKATT